MKRSFFAFILTAFWLILVSSAYCANIGSNVYGIHSESYAGMKNGVDNPPDADGAKIETWGGGIALSDDTTDFYEGKKSFRCDRTAGSAGGFWIQFGSGTQVPTDMSSYANGKTSFWIKTSTQVEYKIEWGVWYGSKFINPTTSWAYVAYDLNTSSFSGIDLTTIKVPAGFHFNANYAGILKVDNLLWRKPSDGTLGITLKNISDGQTTNQFSWSGINLGSTVWKAANQYMEISLDYYSPGCAIQIYTDNKNAGASPQYSGSGNPAGLVDATQTSNVLPACWRVVRITTNTYNIVEGSDTKLYSSGLGGQAGGYTCFMWMKDKGTAAYVDGEDFVTLWDNRGIQHAENTWSPEMSKIYVYIGAKFSSAVSQRTYSTNRLTVELFYE